MKYLTDVSYKCQILTDESDTCHILSDDKFDIVFNFN